MPARGTNATTSPDPEALLEPIGSDADAMRAVMEEYHQPTVKQLTSAASQGQVDASVLLLPKGMAAVSVKPFMDPWRTQPERREGTAAMTDLASFIAHAKRNKDEASALFAEGAGMSARLLAIYDYHLIAGPQAITYGTKDGVQAVERETDNPARWCGHRCGYDFPMSDEWRAWFGQSGEKMGQADFAAFLEEHIADLIPPPNAKDLEKTNAAKIAKHYGAIGGPDKLMAVARGLKVTSTEKVEQSQNLQTGEIQVTYSQDHGDGKVKVPGLFFIVIPVFQNGTAYRIAVRLRYRLSQGAVIWFFELYRADLVFRDAFQADCAKAAQETGLPLFYGKPEAVAVVAGRQEGRVMWESTPR